MAHDDLTPITASNICDVLGRRAIAARVGVGVTAVSNASVEGIFSAAWYDTIRLMCQEAGIECPRSLFKWKRAISESEQERPGGSINSLRPFVF